MESALVAIVSVALVIITMVTMTMTSLHSASTLADSWKQMEQQAGSIRRTEIATVPPVDYSGGLISLTVQNEGQTNLSNFSRWDVIVQYQGGGVRYLTYTDNITPESNQWTVEGIYLPDSSAEVFDLNILNPGEKMIVDINLNPEISEGDTGKITIATPNGVTSQCLVLRQPPP